MMIYYRLALQDRQTARWIWKTTALTSLQAVFQLLRIFGTLPLDSIRVFTASSKKDLNVLLSGQKNNLASSSVTATQFLQQRKLAVGERAQSASNQRVSVQAVQPEATVATWAKELWDKHATMRTAQAVQPGATVALSSPLREYNTPTGTPSSIGMSLLKQKRLEIECGPGGDHDTPYRFTLPSPCHKCWPGHACKHGCRQGSYHHRPSR